MAPGIEYEDPDNVVHTRYGVIASHISMQSGLHSRPSARLRQRGPLSFSHTHGDVTPLRAIRPTGLRCSAQLRSGTGSMTGLLLIGTPEILSSGMGSAHLCHWFSHPSPVLSARMSFVLEEPRRLFRLSRRFVAVAASRNSWAYRPSDLRGG
jgi:hypothetical protein